MKAVPILLTLAAGAAAQNAAAGPEAAAATATTGNIRATKLAGDKAQRRAAAKQANHPNKASSNKKEKRTNRRSKHADQSPEARKKRRDLTDKFHKMLKEGPSQKKDTVKNDDRNLKQEKTSESKKEDRKLKQDKRQVQLEMGPKVAQEKGKVLSNEERELKKAKSGKDSGGWGGGGWSPDHDDWSHDGWSPDGWGRPSDDSDHSGDRWSGDSWDRWDYDDDWKGGGKSGKDGSWGGGGGGKWGGGGGKSGKGGGGWGGGKSGKGGGGGWGSGKSGKDGGGGCSDGYAYVTVTNLSFEQSFSELFIMTATKDVTWRRPVFIFGNSTNDALATLAQEADATDMLRRYDHRHGVEQTKIFNDYDQGGDDFQKDFLQGGSRARFKVRTSGNGHRLTIAAGLPFTNDGAVVLEGARIYEGAEYYVPAIDVGVEGNIQTCWSVAAKKDDFPFRSQCADDDDSDENFNNIPGENFVSMHRGLHDFDKSEDLENLLLFPECKDFDLDDCEDDKCFAEYFFLNDFDDDDLLCDSGPLGVRDCDFRDDQDFIDNVQDYDDGINLYFEIAGNSDDFQDFCDRIVDANKDIEDALTTLEPWIFDWRNEMMHVEIDCGWGGDGHYGGRFWGHGDD